MRLAAAIIITALAAPAAAQDGMPQDYQGGGASERELARWYLDGRQVAASKPLAAQFERHRTICEGRSAAAMAPGRGLITVITVWNAVMKGCMYEFGYERR